MVADQTELSRRPPQRLVGALLGLCYSLPLAVWLAGRLMLTPAGAAASFEIEVAVAVQALAVALVLPWLAAHRSLRTALSQIGLVTAYVWPVLALAWLAAHVSAVHLVAAEAALLAAALVVGVVVHRLLRAVGDERIDIAKLSLQVPMLLALWYGLNGVAGWLR